MFRYKVNGLSKNPFFFFFKEDAYEINYYYCDLINKFNLLNSIILIISNIMISFNSILY